MNQSKYFQDLLHSKQEEDLTIESADGAVIDASATNGGNHNHTHVADSARRVSFRLDFEL